VLSLVVHMEIVKNFEVILKYHMRRWRRILNRSAFCFIYYPRSLFCITFYCCRLAGKYWRLLFYLLFYHFLLETTLFVHLSILLWKLKRNLLQKVKILFLRLNDWLLVYHRYVAMNGIGFFLFLKKVLSGRLTIIRSLFMLGGFWK